MPAGHRRHLEQVAQRGAMRVGVGIVGEVRVLPEHDERRHPDVGERRARGLRAPSGRRRQRPARSGSATRARPRRGDREARPRRPPSAPRGAGSRRSACRRPPRSCRTCGQAARSPRPRARRGVGSRAPGRAARVARPCRRSGPRARARGARRTSGRATSLGPPPSVESSASRWSAIRHGGSHGEAPWPRRSGARTWCVSASATRQPLEMPAPGGDAVKADDARRLLVAPGMDVQATAHGARSSPQSPRVGGRGHLARAAAAPRSAPPPGGREPPGVTVAAQPCPDRAAFVPDV